MEGVRRSRVKQGLLAEPKQATSPVSNERLDAKAFCELPSHQDIWPLSHPRALLTTQKGLLFGRNLYTKVELSWWIYIHAGCVQILLMAHTSLGGRIQNI